MPLTLKQVISRLRQLAESHKQINSFYYDSPVNWLTKGEVVYPAVFVQMRTGSISKVNRTKSWDFEFMFCDLCNVSSKAGESDLELESDLTSIAEDFKAMMEYHEYRDWEIGDINNLQYRREELEDLVIGVQMTVQISTDYVSDRCQVPTLIDFETDPELTYLITEDGNILTTEDGDGLTI